MPGTKTNERPGTRAVAKFVRVSPYKVREVLDLIRGQHVDRAGDTLLLCDRDAAIPVAKLLRSAVANAEANDGLDPEELYVSACYADEGPTLKRYRYRARGRATRVRKRTCHITVIVSRMGEDELRRYRARQAADVAERRARRVAGGRRGRRRAEAAGVEEAQAVEETSTEATAVEEGAVDEVTEDATDEITPGAEALEAADTEGSDAQGESSEEPVESGALEATEAEDDSGADDTTEAGDAATDDDTAKEEEQ